MNRSEQVIDTGQVFLNFIHGYAKENDLRNNLVMESIAAALGVVCAASYIEKKDAHSAALSCKNIADYVIDDMFKSDPTILARRK